MAASTNKYKLTKPELSEKVQVEVLNSNMDMIDSVMDDLQNQITTTSNKTNTNTQNLSNHISNTNNPHNVTKQQLNLGNVENKSSATIRGELTKNNVTNALGYTPYTPNEIDNKFATLETKIDWKEAVGTFNDINTTYPNPEDGWTVNVKDTDYTYRFDGAEWVVISANAIPKATNNIDGLLTKEDHIKYEDANNKKHTHNNKSVLDGITDTLITAWNEAVNHISDTIKHITASERIAWNTAKWHADSAHARTDATKVEKSSINGNIKIDGTETNVYTHPSGTNPHGTTKTDVGLSNVPNVATNDQTPTFTQAVSRVNITSGEKLSIIFGKIMKWFTDLKDVAFSGSYNDLSDRPNDILKKTGDTMSGNLVFANSGTDMRGLKGIMGDNDAWRIMGGATASNAGFLEIATDDDATEPIYFRQYSGGGAGTFTTLKRTLTLLDANGNSIFPGKLEASGEIISRNQNQFRAIYGNYGVILRNDGSNTYILLTKSGDASGSWTDARPLTINNATGVCNINGSATKLANARNIGNAAFDGTANITLSKIGAVAKTGDTISGQLVVQKGIMIHSSTAREGSTYLKLASFKISGTYTDSPISLEITRRSLATTCKLFIVFQNANSTDPVLYSFIADSVSDYGVYIHKSATSTWDLYVTCPRYDQVDVISFNIPKQSAAINVTWKDENVSAVPSGAIKAGFTGNKITYSSSEPTGLPVGSVWVG